MCDKFSNQINVSLFKTPPTQQQKFHQITNGKTGSYNLKLMPPPSLYSSIHRRSQFSNTIHQLLIVVLHFYSRAIRANDRDDDEKPKCRRSKRKGCNIVVATPRLFCLTPKQQQITFNNEKMKRKRKTAKKNSLLSWVSRAPFNFLREKLTITLK